MLQKSTIFASKISKIEKALQGSIAEEADYAKNWNPGRGTSWLLVKINIIVLAKSTTFHQWMSCSVRLTLYHVTANLNYMLVNFEQAWLAGVSLCQASTRVTLQARYNLMCKMYGFTDTLRFTSRWFSYLFYRLLGAGEHACSAYANVLYFLGMLHLYTYCLVKPLSSVFYRTSWLYCGNHYSILLQAGIKAVINRKYWCE